MTHPLNGQWKIDAVTPVMKMSLVAEMNVNEDGKTFTGNVTETKTGAKYQLANCEVEGNHIKYKIVMKLGLIPMSIALEGTFNEADWTCQGTGKAMKMDVSYTGSKIQ